MQKDKKKIVIFIDWFLPGYKAGGPITSVANIITHLKDDFEFFIITSDRDIGDSTPYVDIKINTWINKKGFQIIYLSPENQKKSKYQQLFLDGNFDFVYFNSLFSVKFTLLPLIIAKKFFKNNHIVLAPRGMLGKGAVEIKLTKKKVFIFISKLTRLFKGITWHSTDQQESKDISNAYGKNHKIIEAANLTLTPEKYFPKGIEGDLKLFFYSRISRKKNLDYALNILENLDINVVFDIIGPVEDVEYWNKCENIIKKLPDNIKVNYLGIVKPDEVLERLNKYHFLFLPTKHENFGHVIFEAFAASCPVIISNQTTWQNLEQKNIGWDIDLSNPKKYQQVIENCAELSQENYDEMSRNAFNFAKNFTNDEKLIQNIKNLFE